MNFLSVGVIFGIIFAIVVVCYWLMVFFMLYHLVRFGIGTAPKRIAVLYLAGSAVLFSTALLCLSAIDLGNIQDRANGTLSSYLPAPHNTIVP
jgi:hypothetical protein